MSNPSPLPSHSQRQASRSQLSTNQSGSAASRLREHPLGWHYEDLSAFSFKLTVPGRPVVLKNSKQIFVRPGAKFPTVTMSKAAKQWMTVAAACLREQWYGVFSVPFPADVRVNASIVSYMPDNRSKPDASNLYEAPQDALKSCAKSCKARCRIHSGVLVDDYQIQSHNGSDRLLDRKNPRTEILLTPYYPRRMTAHFGAWSQPGGVW